MKNTLQVLESRVLLASAGDEILKFTYSEAFCSTPPGEVMTFGMAVRFVDEIYHSSGELDICTGGNCLPYTGTVQTTGLPDGVLLIYKGPKDGDGMIAHEMTLKTDGTARDCFEKGETVHCDTIRGEIKIPSV